jgi:hypothetical protein
MADEPKKRSAEEIMAQYGTTPKAEPKQPGSMFQSKTDSRIPPLPVSALMGLNPDERQQKIQDYENKHKKGAADAYQKGYDEGYKKGFNTPLLVSDTQKPEKEQNDMHTKNGVQLGEARGKEALSDYYVSIKAEIHQEPAAPRKK